MAEVRILGIRHHGAGSGRSVIHALQTWKPDMILIEGATEADDLIPFVIEKEMIPPVAMLIYSEDKPQHAVFYPFAEYSPEWQAMKYACESQIPAHFIDLPKTNWLALDIEEQENPQQQQETTHKVSQDPLRWIAEASGYSDSERWWEHLVEKRQDHEGIFEGILELMKALREDFPEKDKRTLQREAAMRKGIRTAQKEGYQRIAVICGAWHAPALLDLKNAKEDDKILKGLPKIKLKATWIAWTYQRLSTASGYGAGVESPAWYEMLWKYGKEAPLYWATEAAHLLRRKDLDASTAGVIEAVRLAEALAALRNCPLAGLPELTEAIQTTLCFGANEPLALIQEEIIIGNKTGQIPEKVPQIPIQQDFYKHIKALRFKLETQEKPIELDLRKEFDLKKSHFIHRLLLLAIPMAKEIQTYNKKGSFHEHWLIKWKPEYEIMLIEANLWGNTIRNAASTWAIHTAQNAQFPSDLAALIKQVLYADLPETVEPVLRKLNDLATLSHDVSQLMQTVPSLVQVVRYGNVRQTDSQAVEKVIQMMLSKIFVGLPTACMHLNEEAALQLYPLISDLHWAMGMLNKKDLTQDWQQMVLKITHHPATHPLIAGRCLRISIENGSISAIEAEKMLFLALSSKVDALYASFWIEGFLDGSAQILLYSEDIWQYIFDWIQQLSPESFVENLPILRRTFSKFSKAERSQMNQKVSNVGRVVNAQAHTQVLDKQRTEAILQTLMRIFE